MYYRCMYVFFITRKKNWLQCSTLFLMENYRGNQLFLLSTFLDDLSRPISEEKPTCEKSRE